MVELGRRHGTIVLTRGCAGNRVRSVTSFINSSLRLSHGTTTYATRMVIFYNIHFVTRATGVLSPSTAILLPMPSTNYPVTSVTSASRVGTYHTTGPSTIFITCIGAATRAGALISVYYASNGTRGVVSSVPRSGGVIFLPSNGLNTGLVHELKHGVAL